MFIFEKRHLSFKGSQHKFQLYVQLNFSTGCGKAFEICALTFGNKHVKNEKYLPILPQQVPSDFNTLKSYLTSKSPCFLDVKNTAT